MTAWRRGRVTRKGEPPIRSFFARRFYAMMHRLSKTDIVDGARDYRLMTRQFVNELLRLGEYNRFSKGLFGWVGFETKWLEYENVERSAGETKWSFWKLLLYSVEGIVGFTTAPLAMAAFLGIFFCLVAFLALCFIIVRTLMFGDPVSGWPSMTCIIIFIGGIQLFCIGILGEYLAKTYMETKRRPDFYLQGDECGTGRGGEEMIGKILKAASGCGGSSIRGTARAGISICRESCTNISLRWRPICRRMSMWR